MKFSLLVLALILVLPRPALADDCEALFNQYTERCYPPEDKDGLVSVPACHFSEAKTNFLWATKLNPGAVETFRKIFDRCDQTDNDPRRDVINKNAYAAALAQTHNTNAMCSISNCWANSELDGYLVVEYGAGRLYGAKPTNEAKPTNCKAWIKYPQPDGGYGPWQCKE